MTQRKEKGKPPYILAIANDGIPGEVRFFEEEETAVLWLDALAAPGNTYLAFDSTGAEFAVAGYKKEPGERWITLELKEEQPETASKLLMTLCQFFTCNGVPIDGITSLEDAITRAKSYISDPSSGYSGSGYGGIAWDR